LSVCSPRALWRGTASEGRALLDRLDAVQTRHAAGGTFVPAGILVRFAQDRQKPSDDGPSENKDELIKSLTPRELEVLTLLRKGKPNKIIAHELDITESTVKVFVGRISSKLRVANRTELVVLPRTWPADGEPDGADQR
jgi:DNA-binding NarL/FixJ family response regulator